MSGHGCLRSVVLVIALIALPFDGVAGQALLDEPATEPVLLADAGVIDEPSNTEAAGQVSVGSGSNLGTVRFYANNWTRVSGWDYFNPGSTGGDPSYGYVANRLRIGMRWQTANTELHAAGQQVQFSGVPTSAAGPGPLGLGAAYRGQGNASTNPGGLYVRYLHFDVKKIGNTGLSFSFGRFGYSGGGESTAADSPKVNRVKAMRVTDKLIGEFGWSLYQRGFDGVRGDWTHGFGKVTVAAFQPTQGGFENRAGISIDDIRVHTGVWTLGSVVPNSELQLFLYDYDDERNVTGFRPDGSGLKSTNGIDVRIQNAGFHLVSANRAGSGEVDSLVWYSYQTGSWFGQTHRAQAVALEAGYQWDAPMRPWLRVGYLRGTGDDDPTDQTHGTFFQMLPTTRKYSLSTAYNMMNNTDLFVQALLTPAPGWSIRADYHKIGLSNANDRWHFGAGATQAKGTVFGFGTRPSFGESSFGNVFEVQASHTINSHWSVSGYYGHIRGSNVVRGNFPGSDKFNFAYFENVLKF